MNDAFNSQPECNVSGPEELRAWWCFHFGNRDLLVLSRVECWEFNDLHAVNCSHQRGILMRHAGRINQLGYLWIIIKKKKKKDHPHNIALTKKVEGLESNKWRRVCYRLAAIDSLSSSQLRWGNTHVNSTTSRSTLVIRLLAQHEKKKALANSRVLLVHQNIDWRLSSFSQRSSLTQRQSASV